MAIYQTSDYDTDDQFDWTRIQYTIEDDVIIATRTLFDAGYEVFGTYEDALLVEEYYHQTLDALGFQNRTIRYDTDGVMTYRGTTYEDALRVTEDFAGGVRTQTLMQDGFFGPGVTPWSEILFTHDSAGNITSRQTKFDDGHIETEQFVPGVRETRQDFEQVRPWDRIDTSFDTNGDMSGRVTTYDSGVVKQVTYAGGQKKSVMMSDNPGSAGDGVKSWTQIVSRYDDDGAVMGRLTDYDNGVTKTESFSAGQRVGITQTDAQDAKPWNNVTTQFENGQIAQKRVEADSGDVTVTLYSDGKRSQLLQYDGDESASWLLRVTEFPAVGGREVTLYDAADDIPATLLAYLPEITPPDPREERRLDFDNGQRIYTGDSILDGAFTVGISKGQHNIQGILTPYEYGGDSGDPDMEAFNSWGATVAFDKTDADGFDFKSLSLANSSKADTTNIPTENWANIVTINGYREDLLVQTIDVDLRFEHETHVLDWQDLDRIEFVASGGGISNDHVQDAGWFSMDDLVFLV